MILISSYQYDYTTNDVIDWIVSFERQFTRINKKDQYKILFDGSKIELEFKDQVLNFEDIKGYFYRRGKIGFNQDNGSVKYLRDITIEHSEIIDQYINYILENKVSIGKHSNNALNKLIVLQVAKSIGLKIPDSYIFTSKEDAEISNQNLITKNHSNSSFFQCDDGVLIAYTAVLDKDTYQKLPDSFSPSLFQKRIKKKYELRIFYLKKKIWSTAIFSQANTATENDYRKNSEDVVRNVPYSLPDEIKEKIITLMNRLNLDTGSIDLIVNTQDEYIFLEINPIGQFGSVSFNCNYNIEKEIANILIHEDK